MKVLTANRLSDGIVVFLAAGERWHESVDGAWVVGDDASEARALAIGEAQAAAQVIVEPYLIDVERTAAGLVPVRLRERIRAEGPTIRLDLGKQAEASRRGLDDAA